jgi:hypothetical protein
VDFPATWNVHQIFLHGVFDDHGDGEESNDKGRNDGREKDGHLGQMISKIVK